MPRRPTRDPDRTRHIRLAGLVAAAGAAVAVLGTLASHWWTGEDAGRAGGVRVLTVRGDAANGALVGIGRADGATDWWSLLVPAAVVGAVVALAAAAIMVPLRRRQVGTIARTSAVVVAGAAVALAGTLASHWWGVSGPGSGPRALVTSVDPDPDPMLPYSSSLHVAYSSTSTTDWWSLLWPAALVGADVALVVLTVVRARRGRQ